MKADIDRKQRLFLMPETLTESTALQAWWASLPADVLPLLENRLACCYAPGEPDNPDLHSPYKAKR